MARRCITAVRDQNEGEPFGVVPGSLKRTTYSSIVLTFQRSTSKAAAEEQTESALKTLESVMR